MNKLSTKELTYFFLSAGAVLILFWLFSNDKFLNYLNELNPIIQFLVLNLGLYIIFFLLFKFLSNTTRRRAWEGSLASILTFIGFDLILPEYHVTAQGLIKGGLLGASSSDYFFGYIYQLMGFSGNTLVFMVYVVTFLALFLIGAFLYKDYLKYI